MLVKLYRDNNLPDEVGIELLNERSSLYILDVSKRRYHMPPISYGILKALEGERILDLRNDPYSHDRTITFRKRIFTAVDTDFGENREATPLPTDGTSIGFDIKVFREILERDYKLEEIRTLCQDMQIKYENLGGVDTLESRVRELIEYCQRRGRLLELLIRTAKARPRNPWHELWL